MSLGEDHGNRQEQHWQITQEHCEYQIWKEIKVNCCYTHKIFFNSNSNFKVFFIFQKLTYSSKSSSFNIITEYRG